MATKKSSKRVDSNGTPVRPPSRSAEIPLSEPRGDERRVETSIYRTWKPVADDADQQLVCELGEIREIPTRYGQRKVINVTVLEAGEDGDGEYGEGEQLEVWLSAGLRALGNLEEGAIVRIVPAGMGGKEGRRRLYDVFERRPRST